MSTRAFMSRLTFLTLLLSLLAVQAFAGGRFIDDNDTVTLQGNTHPLAHRAMAKSAADTSLRMDHMVMALQISAAKQAALSTFLKQQHDPTSPNYHKWLTPDQFAAQFGPSAADVADITTWLTSHGFKIDEVAKSRMWINFSGDVNHVEQAFRTQISTVTVDGKSYHANTTDPSIPRALSDVVSGVVTLHNIPRKPKHNGATAFPSNQAVPNYTSGSYHYLAPGDFATIYNVNPLYNAGLDGTGQSIAIVGRTHPAATNWSTFRSKMGLPANAPQVIVNGTDPGDLGANEDTEANLDVEWAGAVAKNATIKFVTSQSTNTTDGVDLSAQYIVANNVAPIVSLSFGSCESDMGATENTFYNNLWAQAAAQGQTVLVAAGDSGAAGCSDPSGATGSGKAVNGLASTPYNIAVGGTQFNEGSTQYWNSVSTTSMTSALGYIPEVVWNESGSVSGGSGLWATGGGASQIYSKPSWQVATGVPQDGSRDIPDVSLSGAGHDSYLIVTGGSLSAVSGTSAGTPSFAGIVALLLQKTGQRIGNANVGLYQLANLQYGANGASVFHDVTSGSNSVPGVTGYSAASGYDQATGLGSVDANALVTNWGATGSTTSSPSFSLAAVSPVSITAGKSGSVSVQVSVANGFNSSVTFSVSGLPSGVTGTFTPASLAAPGSGTTTLSLNVASTVTVGTRTVTVTATGGGITRTQSFSLTVLAGPDFSLSAPSSGSILVGNSGTLSVATAVSGGFSSSVALAVSGLPSGVTASFAPTTIAAPGSGTSVLTLTVASTATAGTSTLTITATGGGITHTTTFALTIQSGALYSSSFTDNWLTTSVSGRSARWYLASSGTYPTVTPHTGTAMAQFNSYSATSGNSARLFTSGRLTIPSTAKSATLSFWMYHDPNRPTKNDTVQAQLSTNGSTWANVGAAVARYAATAGWTQVSVDISSYIGKSVYLGFLGTSAAGYNMYLDDLSVTVK
ncbi:protease pro-enzyme activation domain-containing protein [Geomesophilobacter sediminis]|uniref:S8/S53 family peptidase n=1 Tax=Geomesophilobacter sediminis TaxID=2798584 RepID=A0A8J7LZD6_9BACT|nr:protease pro-enzyme activation domain-containing protein [Geomesophilobacter sediminis]MBJ6726241.1 S8/S53 family peptidase [Geomesophilobacter sediminis]